MDETKPEQPRKMPIGLEEYMLIKETDPNCKDNALDNLIEAHKKYPMIDGDYITSDRSEKKGAFESRTESDKKGNLMMLIHVNLDESTDIKNVYVNYKIGEIVVGEVSQGDVIRNIEPTLDCVVITSTDSSRTLDWPVTGKNLFREQADAYAKKVTDNIWYSIARVCEGEIEAQTKKLQEGLDLL